MLLLRVFPPLVAHRSSQRSWIDPFRMHAYCRCGFLTGFASVPVLGSLERVRAQRQLAAVVRRLHQATVSVHVHVHVHRRGSIY